MQALINHMQPSDAVSLPVGGSPICWVPSGYGVRYGNRAADTGRHRIRCCHWSPPAAPEHTPQLSAGLQLVMPQTPVIGVTVSRAYADRAPKVVKLQNELAQLFDY